MRIYIEKNEQFAVKLYILTENEPSPEDRYSLCSRVEQREC